MPIALHCLSHTPVFGHVEPGPGVQDAVDAALDRVRDEIAAFAPELVVLFSPDHYNGFFHSIMPPFCIGIAARSIGDYGSTAGALPVPEEEAVACIAACHAAGVDVAMSRAMVVDHGFAQPLDLVCGGIGTYPVIPVFLNAIGAPVAPIARSRALGAAIGAHLGRGDRDRRVLVMASGGLSHDPPVPQLDTAPPEIRARMIAGGERPPEAQAAHERRVIDGARAYAAVDDRVGGGGPVPLNPEWDERFLELLNAGRFDAIDAMTTHEIAVAAGGSANEIRSWVAAYACAAAYGDWHAETRFYRAIPQWMAGFAVASGSSV